MNLFLAPIQGMTNACYRNAYAKIFGGIDAYYAPFISTADMRKVNISLLKDILPERNDPSIKVVPQLLSNNGNDFILFAKAISNMGYEEINWNIGCPFSTVTKKKKGAGILPYPDMIRKFLDIACSDDSYTITVKMRLGLKDKEEGIKVIEILNEYPLSGVIIHARTGDQKYSGNVDLDSFEAIASICRHQVTYNGDIFTYDDFIRISTRFPNIKNFMLGRGALRDPFLPSAIKGRTVPSSEKLKIIKHFHDEIFNYYKNALYGDKHLCDRMKEFWKYMLVHIDREGKLFKKIKKCNTTADYLETVKQIFDNSYTWSDAPLSDAPLIT